MLYFEDVELGAEVGPLEIEATDERVIAFCHVWGQAKASRFTDQATAEKVGLPGPIVPGIMSMAMMTRLLTNWAGPDTLKDLDLVFRQPVPHNRPLKISATVTDTRQEDGENLVECDILLTGSEGERHVGGKAILALPNRA
ncbi:MAG: MaoC/PaaZ C-terminal domain-containing protein [Dehalococcoidia bacterium]|nr:MaoC/PaaZ C-terminal domain-containing protein [Dehalococcoidia bacterium]